MWTWRVCWNSILLQVYFGVSTLLDASSSDGMKAEEEQKEVIQSASLLLLSTVLILRCQVELVHMYDNLLT